MLDFRRSDGTIKRTALYTYVKKHKDDPEVMSILAFDTGSLIGNYRKYLETSTSSVSDSQTAKILERASQEFDYESGEGTSSCILDATKTFTETELLKQHGYDPEKWKIVKHQCSKWHNGVQVLMSSKIFVKPRNILEGSTEQIFAAFDKALKLEPITFEPTKTTTGQKLLVLPVSDLHFGLLADEYTSDNIYNMEIATDRLMNFVTTAIENTKLSNKDTILLTLGNDFFNCDNVQGTTVHGTAQDNEASYITTWHKGVQLGISVIEYLLTNTACNVHVANVQGNHDLQSSHAMITAIYYNYKDSKRVSVDYTSDEKTRYYYKFGENLLGFGHETKIKECHRIMSSECKDWSNYKYRTMFLGHLHKEEVLDTGALVVRRLPILSGKSAWTDSKGYMAHPRAQAFVFDATRGLVNTVNVEIE